MPLFGKRRTKLEELGLHNLSFMLYPVRLAHELFGMALAQSAQDQPGRRLFLAWVCGGIKATDALLDMPELGGLWHGSRQETLGLTRVFTLAMVSRWAFRRWRELDVQTLSQNLHFAAVDVIGFFGGADGAALEDFTITASHFFAEKPGQHERELTEMDLVVSLAAQELGRPLPIPLARLRLPIDFWGMINAGWRPFFDLGASTEALLRLSATERFMFRIYDTWASANVEI